MEQEPISLLLGLSITGLGSVEMWRSPSPSPPILQRCCTKERAGAVSGLSQREIRRSLLSPSLQLFNAAWPPCPAVRAHSSSPGWVLLTRVIRPGRAGGASLRSFLIILWIFIFRASDASWPSCHQCCTPRPARMAPHLPLPSPGLNSEAMLGCLQGT